MSNFTKVLEILREDKKDLSNELKDINQQLKLMKGGFNSNLHNDKSSKDFIDRRDKLIKRKEEIISKLKVD